MKKLIVLSSVLVMGAIGMACGDSANNGNKSNVNANANVKPIPPVANNTSVGNAMNTVSNTVGNAVNTVANTVKPANNSNKPAPSPTKKP